MKQAISDETRSAILDAAWELVGEAGRLDVSQSEIAARAGVSRQSVYLAFGGRAGLLLGMVRNKDRRTDHVARLRAIATGDGDQVADLIALIDVWIDYLPLVYPVAIQLDAASVNDPAAASAWDSRMKTGLLEGIRMVLGRVARAGRLPSGIDVDRAADHVWSLVHLVSWRVLVAERGWSAEEFRRRQTALIRSVLAS